jgi:hypothetical protein
LATKEEKMICKRLKRAVTDPYTGERTYITTTEKTGRVSWTHSAEWEADKRRAIEMRQKKQEISAQFERWASIPTETTLLNIDSTGLYFLAID